MYTLEGVDGNAFAIMAYTKNALIKTGRGNLVNDYIKDAMSSDYSHLLKVSQEHIELANSIS